MPATNFTKNKILNYNFGGTGYDPDDGGQFYFGLSTELIDEEGSSTEPSGFDYDRVTIDNDTTTWPSTTTEEITNDITIEFPPSNGGTWGLILSIFIADSATPEGGNVLWYQTLSPSLNIPDDTTVSFAPGTIIITM